MIHFHDISAFFLLWLIDINAILMASNIKNDIAFVALL